MTRNVGPQALAVALLCFGGTLGGGCGAVSRGDGDAAIAHLELSPADASITIIDGVPQTQAYTATLVEPNGHRTDVTSTVSFAVSSAGYGTWTGPTLTVSGAAGGVTRVIATDGVAQGETGLTIYLKGTRSDGVVPPNAAGLFDAATETAGRAPTIAYPSPNILVPPNLGEFDVHWQGGSNNLFQISLQNAYVDLRIIKAASGAAFTTFTPNEWFALASSDAQLTLTVAGLDINSPATKGTSAPQHVDVTNEIVQGGMYYWTTSPTQGVYRYDMSTPNTPPASYYGPGQQPTGCLGCHALSRDGTKLALTLDSGDGRGTVVNVADQSVLVPFASNAQYWNFATFNPDASKLVTLWHGAMVLRNTAGGAVISSIPNTPGTSATHPELSPDGSHLAHVETTNLIYDFQVGNGGIVTRTFDNATNAFGPIQMLVPNVAGQSSYYPSYSPDGEWIVFTRTVGNSYNDASAESWVVKADGTQPPIKLALADQASNLTNSWARWAPFRQTFGTTGEPVFYLTFSTTRPFGVRSAGGTQIWMTPFFPARAAAGQDPSGPAFRMPFQLLGTANHIAQWTQAIVIGKNADGTPRTQAQAAREAAKAATP